jgi:TonB family protein
MIWIFEGWPAMRISTYSHVVTFVDVLGVAQQPPTTITNLQSATKQVSGKSDDHGSGEGKQAVGSLDVLSDTMGVDFGPYLARVLDVVRENWYRSIPDSARAPEMKKGRVSIEFAILKDGSVRGLQIVGTSGDVSLDRGAYKGIITSKPFLPLPTEFGGQYLALRIHFYYNPSRADLHAELHEPTVRIAILPTSAQVLSGTTQQFSATVITLKGNVNTTLNWSVVGPGCVGAACGTISATGLYTTPVSVPTPLTVRVRAALTADPSQAASATVNIVSGSPSR